MPWQKLSDEPAVDVVPAPRAVTDQHAQRFAAVKIRNRFCLDADRDQQHRRSNASRRAHHERFAQSTVLVEELIICSRFRQPGRWTHLRWQGPANGLTPGDAAGDFPFVTLPC